MKMLSQRGGQTSFCNLKARHEFPIFVISTIWSSEILFDQDYFKILNKHAYKNMIALNFYESDDLYEMFLFSLLSHPFTKNLKKKVLSPKYKKPFNLEQHEKVLLLINFTRLALHALPSYLWDSIFHHISPPFSLHAYDGVMQTTAEKKKTFQHWQQPSNFNLNSTWRFFRHCSVFFFLLFRKRIYEINFNEVLSWEQSGLLYRGAEKFLTKYKRKLFFFPNTFWCGKSYFKEKISNSIHSGKFTALSAYSLSH